MLEVALLVEYALIEVKSAMSISSEVRRVNEFKSIVKM
jgi:hypothetical protein